MNYRFGNLSNECFTSRRGKAFSMNRNCIDNMLDTFLEFGLQHKGKCLMEMGRLDEAEIEFIKAFKIDFAVFIDTPLDIAMARRVIRDFKNSPVENILLDMNSYILQGRQGYLEMLNTIKPNYDIIVDGTLSISEIVSIISRSIVLNVYK